MKKLIYIANIRFPTEKAHGFQIAKMCESFAKLGLDVTLFIPNRPTPINEEPLVFYNIKEKFQIETLHTWRVSMRPGFFGKIIYYLQGINFALAVLKKLQQESTVCIPASAGMTSQDVIFSRDPFSALLLTMMRYRVCYEIHDFPKVHWRNRWLLQNVEKIVVTNTHKKSALANKFNLSKDKILVAQNGVDLAPFITQQDKKTLRQNFNLPQDKKIVMYTGHLYSWKGVDTLLAAAKQLPALEFVLVGGTKDDLAKYKEQYKDTNIHFLGHKPQNQIPYYLMASDCLVLPNTAKETISNFDTSPIKLFEYMASRTPIVASNINSIHEIVSGDEVEFAKADDAADLAKKISLVLENKPASDGRATRAWQKVQQFTWDNRAKHILEFLKQ